MPTIYRKEYPSATIQHGLKHVIKTLLYFSRIWSTVQSICDHPYPPVEHQCSQGKTLRTHVISMASKL